MRTMKVCIMCGGEGTRLRPLTFERPKPCIPIVNRPSIQHLVAHLTTMGFREVVLTLGYMGKSIEGPWRRIPLRRDITYVHEEIKLGTAGSVKTRQETSRRPGLPGRGRRPCHDLNVLEFYRAHQKEKAMVSVGLISIDDPASTVSPRSMSVRDQTVKEKPAPGRSSPILQAPGCTSAARRSSTTSPRVKYDFARDLFPKLMGEGQVLKGWLARGNWTDVGSPHSLRQAERWKLQDIAFTDIIGDLSIHGAQVQGPVQAGRFHHARQQYEGDRAGGDRQRHHHRGQRPDRPLHEHRREMLIRNNAKIFSSSLYNRLSSGPHHDLREYHR